MEVIRYSKVVVTNEASSSIKSPEIRLKQKIAKRIGSTKLRMCWMELFLHPSASV